MELNQTLLKLLKILATEKSIGGAINFNSGSAVIANFIEVDNESILLNQKDIEKKIILDDAGGGNSIATTEFEEFIKKLSPNIVRLNHVGISYFCPNLSLEIEYYRNLLKDSILSLYEENSGIPEKRWIFIGNNPNRQDTLFELILVESLDESRNAWLPDFQIDIDTTLSVDEIKRIANQTIREGFIDWEFNIPDYGVVLCSGILGNVNETKISIGIGTKLRDFNYQRESLVKLN